MKKIIAGVILVLFCSMIAAPLVEAKTNATKTKKVSAYVKTKNGHKHVTYTKKQHYKK